jgi:hypothetical protein
MAHLVKLDDVPGALDELGIVLNGLLGTGFTGEKRRRD